MSLPPQALEILHHRSLNSPRAFERGLSLADRLPEARHAHEADICWVADGDSPPLLYTRHPNMMFDRLGRKAVTAGCKAGQMWRLEDALAAARGHAVVLEMKIGTGDRKVALAELVRVAALHDAPVLIDAFSLDLLEIVRAISSSTRLSVHTGRYDRERTTITAPGWPLVKTVSSDHLPVNVVSLRLYGGWHRMWPQIDAVRSAGLVPHMSRLLTPAELVEGARAPLAAIYADPQPYEVGLDALREACAERLQAGGSVQKASDKAP
ncbi:hypothetical protein Mmar10_0767 [Maricaulis maris MCS10]|uniref:Uncharacterized protein n=1 Tax=Maricaulis maris (strain MCS10) TaxID=394221 RepID=Q0ARM7_MARMM|nr:hypothetical protein [Maricaulis maris]ABI65060.1 hypothetical protein Mmar10_0767 [Maricaulis maris MCS10]